MRTQLINQIFALLVVCCLSFSCKNNLEITPIDHSTSQREIALSPQLNAQVSTADPITFNEGLASIYRGIVINSYVGSIIGVSAGYYHLNEFRVAGQPTKTAFALSALKHYGVMAVGPSVLPVSTEPLVFSRFNRNIWTANHREIIVKDLHDNSLLIIADYNSVLNCWTVASAKINGKKVILTTQTYTTGVHNTCGYSEPGWTIF